MSSAEKDFNTLQKGAITSLIERSRRICQTPIQKIRNRTLKMFSRYQRENQVDFDANGVVYVIIAARTRNFYIGSTIKTTTDRVKQHIYKRTCEHSSELSRFVADFPEHLSTLFAFPIYQDDREDVLRETERNFISRFSHLQKMLNTNEKFSRRRKSNHNRGRSNLMILRNHANLQRSSSIPSNVRPREEAAVSRLTLWSQQKAESSIENYIQSLGKRRLRFVLENIKNEKLQARIREEIIKRQKPFQSAPFDYLLHLPYSRRLPRKISSSLVMQSCPFPKCITQRTRVVTRLNDTLGRFACNTSTLCIQPRQMHPCYCDQLRGTIPEECFRQGHLATNQIQNIFDFVGLEPNSKERDELFVLWAQGSKFRSAICVNAALERLQRALTQYVDQVMDGASLEVTRPLDNKEFKEKLQAWKSEVLCRYKKLSTNNRNYIISQRTLEAIRALTDKFVIAPVDKNPQGLALLCIKQYLIRLREHISNVTCETTNRSTQDILETHAKFNQQYGCRHTPALPYIYIVPKLHKEPSRPYDRYIAGYSHRNRVPAADKKFTGVPSGSLHNCSRKLSDFLNSVIDILIFEDKQSMKKGEPRRIWIIRDVREAVTVMKNARALHTHDFSTMYTNFPLDALQRAVECMVVKAMKFIAVNLLRTDEENYTNVCFQRADRKSQWKALWTISDPNDKKKWGCNQVFAVLRFLLTNSYFSNVFGIVRQVVGLSMGAPHSPPAATLGLSAAEVRYVDKMLGSYGAEIVKRDLFNFRTNLRYIDDLGTESDSIPSKDEYYNMDIVRVASCPPEPSIDLLSFKFTKLASGPLQVTLRDKQISFPILLTRYPCHFSTIPEECKIGCVVGVLVTIYRFIDSPSLFRDALNQFFDLLRMRRFTQLIVRKGVMKFLQRNVKFEYFQFLYQHFFAPIVDNWPYRYEIPSHEIIIEECRRHQQYETLPFCWRQTHRPVLSTMSPTLKLKPPLQLPRRATDMFLLDDSGSSDKESTFSSAFFSCHSEED